MQNSRITLHGCFSLQSSVCLTLFLANLLVAVALGDGSHNFRRGRHGRRRQGRLRSGRRFRQQQQSFNNQFTQFGGAFLPRRGRQETEQTNEIVQGGIDFSGCEPQEDGMCCVFKASDKQQPFSSGLQNIYVLDSLFANAKGEYMLD